ncbi:MAG: restriction endonuclease [Gemmatimonadetes bacterium]|nr:restriction endonuclease [Gemmatimonadota bacterium]
MPLDLADYDRKARDAVRAFWSGREHARQKQANKGQSDQGERASVTTGKNMDGFINLVVDLVHANGLPHATIHKSRGLLALPGYFRPTKLWDLLVFNGDHLVAAIELKSHVGPSFGNNFNNRTEEAIGMACDLWTAYREGAFGGQTRPFAAWLILVEDAPNSRSPVRCRSPHFPMFPAFEGASYLKRYDILCRQLVREQMYTTAAVISSPKSASETGEYGCQSEETGLKTFVTSLAGHIAAEAARTRAS